MALFRRKQRAPEPGDQDWVSIRRSAGGFAPGPWDLVSRADITNGTWDLLRSPSSGQLALGFRARRGIALVISAEEIASVTPQADGINMVVDVHAQQGEDSAVFACIAPTTRLKELFAGLGIEL